MIETVTEAYRWGHYEHHEFIMEGETIEHLTNEQLVDLMDRFKVVQVWKKTYVWGEDSFDYEWLTL
jgi:hypothetical protein